VDPEIANLETSSDYERCTMLRLIPYTVHGALTFPKRGLRHEVKRNPLRCALRVFGTRPFGISVLVDKQKKRKQGSPVTDIVRKVIVFPLDLCPSRFITKVAFIYETMLNLSVDICASAGKQRLSEHPRVCNCEQPDRDASEVDVSAFTMTNVTRYLALLSTVAAVFV